MAKHKAQMTGFVGINGRTVEVSEGDEYDSDHEYVQARPDIFGVPGPARAVETVGEIEEVDPTAPQDPDEVVDEASEDPADAGVTTKTAAPLVRRGRKPRNG